MNLIFVRHGQSVWNLENKFTGWVDVELSERGVKEAEEAGSTLLSYKFTPEICATSFLKRSKSTAEIILNKMKEEIQITEADKKGKGSGSKDACYHKVKSRYSVWPSAYASGALVKCRKVGAANWGNKSEEVEIVDEAMSSYDKARKAAAKRAAQRNAERKAGTRGGRMENETYRNEMGTRMHHKGYKVEEVIPEAKVDKGRSDYGKASIRNYRRMGPGYDTPAMFEPENKRGKTIEKRREEHKARRGVKGAKVPAYKVDEEVGITTHSMMMKDKAKKEAMLRMKERDAVAKKLRKEERDEYGDPVGGPKISKKEKEKNLKKNTPDEQHTTTTSEGYGSDRVGPALTMARAIDKVNPRPKPNSKRTRVSRALKMASIKKDEKIRKRQENPYSTDKKLKMVATSIRDRVKRKVKSMAANEDYIPEEGYDIARDMGRVRPSKDKKDATTMPPSPEMKKTQKVNKGPSAFERVKKKYGKAVMVVGKK